MGLAESLLKNNELLAEANADVLDAYEAVKTMHGRVPGHRNADNLAKAIESITGVEEDYGTITVLLEDGTEKELAVNMGTFLNMNGTLGSGDSFTIDGETYKRSQAIAYDTGDTMTSLPAYFLGQNQEDWYSEFSPWSGMKRIRIGKNIKEIPDYCLASNMPLEEIEIVAAETIGNNFSYNNYTMRNTFVNFGSKLKSIGISCFQSCGYFNGYMRFPATLESIDNGFLQYCQNFNQPVSLPASMKNIGPYFMYYCTSFAMPLVLPETIESIGSYFLGYCYSYNHPINIPRGLKTITTNFMYNCQLYNYPLVIPEGVTSIESSLLYNANAFGSRITFPSTVESYGSNILYECRGVYEVVANSPVAPSGTTVFTTTSSSAAVYTEGITITGPYADEWREALPNRVISPFRKVIGNPEPGPFFSYWTESNGDEPIVVSDPTTATRYMQGTSSTTSYNFPSDTTKIVFNKEADQVGVTNLFGTYSPIVTMTSNSKLVAIEGMEHLTTVTTIGSYGFYDKPDFEYVSGLPPNLLKTYSTGTGRGLFHNCAKFNCPIEVPARWGSTMTATNNYALISSCAAFNSPITFAPGTTSVQQVINNCATFNSPITLPDTLTKIGDYAFCRCPAFNQPFTIPESVTVIGYYLFLGFNSFNQPVDISRITSIGPSFLEDAYVYNQELDFSKVTSFGNWFMANCHAYNKPITFGENVTSVDSNYFMYNMYNFTGPLNVNTAPAPSGTYPERCLATDDSSAAQYATGVTITGANAQAWKDRYANSASSPYRKLIVQES